MNNVCKKLTAFMDSYVRRKKSQTGGGYIETSVAREIGTLIKQVDAFSDDNEAKIGVIIGDAGHGKSICLREYARARPDCVYVVLNDTMTATHMFGAICKALKLDDTGSAKKLTKRLIDRLEKKNLTVLLDEASGLNVHKLSMLRQVITISARCPLVLAGNGHLLSTLNQPAAGRGNESLDQFRSRMVRLLNLDEMAGSKDGGLYTSDEIRMLYQYGGINLTTDAVVALKKICQSPQTGRLRTCSHVIQALHLARAVPAGGAIDARLVIAAIRDLGLSATQQLPFSFTLADITREANAEMQVKTKAG